MDYRSNTDLDNRVLYVTGGGGQCKNAINVSTLSAIIVATFGIKVIKHVSYTSEKKCPSSVLLDEFKIKVCTSVQNLETQLDRFNIAFFEAQPEDVLTNFCPLIAPISDTSRFVGINTISLAMPYIFDLKSKGYKNAIIACPSNTDFDEVSICSGTQIFELKDGEISNYVITPEDFGLTTVEPISIVGATPLYNKNISNDIFAKKIRGAKLDVLALNVGVMLYVAGFSQDIKSGIIAAYKAIETNAALYKLQSIWR